MTISKTVPVATKLFTESKWLEISNRVADAFRMTPAERNRFCKENGIAKLIAAIPFLAQCEDAERTSAAHLGTYLLSIRETKPYFNARSEDSASVFERLRLISGFKGGNSNIIRRGMSLLALNMVSDYRRDAEEDVFLRKYNPVSQGDFDFAPLVEELNRTIESIPSAEMEAIYPQAAGPLGFWGG